MGKMTLDPDAQAYTDDEIVGKVNAAAVNITRADAVEDAALKESTNFQKVSQADEDKLAGIAAGAEVNPADLAALDAAQDTKLNGIEADAKGDQTGAEIKTAYEAEPNAFTDTKDTKLTGVEANAKDDQSGAEIKTAYEGEANAYTDTKDTKLTGIEDGADVNPTDDEVVGQINTAAVPITREAALSQGDLKLVKSEPVVGEHVINFLVRKSDGKLEADYNDTPES